MLERIEMVSSATKLAYLIGPMVNKLFILSPAPAPFEHSLSFQTLIDFTDINI